MQAAGGSSATAGASFAQGGTESVGGASLGQGGVSVSSGGSNTRAGGSASGGTSTTSGGMTTAGGFAGAPASSSTPSCENYLVLCGTGVAAKCADVMTDSENCGECGRACNKGAACVSGSCVLHRCTPTFRLGSNPTVETDQAATALAVGDLNADGYLDIVVANSSSNTVSALLGNGKGAFRERIDHTAGIDPVGIAIGDFNRDDRLDVVTVNDESDTVSILLGKGDGTFESDAQYLVGHNPRAISVGDFDGDGSEDLATANWDDGTVSILLGSSNGTFADKADYSTATYPTRILTGDFNDDGKTDLITNGGSSTAQVLLGVGDGTFGASSAVPVGGGGAYASHFALGDLNSDGKQDLIVASRNGRYSSGTFGVLYGAGDGSFLPMVEYDPGAAGPIASADLDRDGNAELVAYTGSQSVSILTLDASGGLAGEAIYPTPAPPQQVVIADFNGDDWPDIATLDSWGIYILIATGNGEFDFPSSQPTNGSLQNVLLHDLDGDGNLDLAGITYDYTTNTASIGVYRGSSSGTFIASSERPARSDEKLIEVGDLNGDGYPDLVTASNSESRVSVLWNEGGASYPNQTDYLTTSLPDFLALGDLDDNGKTDILVATGLMYSQGSSVTALLNYGDGIFFSVTTPGEDGPLGRIALRDLNHDGKLDLVQTDGEQDGLTVQLGLGNGAFGLALPSPTNGSSISSYGAAIGDLNGDGNLDIVASDTSTTRLNVMLGVGDGTFSVLAPQTIAANYAPGHLVPQDMNGDGILDLVSDALVPWIGYQIVVMLGVGDGTFACATASLASGAGYDSFAVGDLNGDKRPDLVVPERESESIIVLLNQSL